MALVRSAMRWEVVAAIKFTTFLEPPCLAGKGSTRVYRDIKGWICNLVHHMHALRWAALSRAVHDAMEAGHITSLDAGVNAVTRAIIENVVVRQPEESRRIVTSNARRQCARKKGRLSLIRLVDLALALSHVRIALAPLTPNDFDVAVKFWQLVECLRGLRAVHDMDSTARSIDLCLFDPSWAMEHASDLAFFSDHVANPAHPMRTAKTEKIIRYAVFRASRTESNVDCPPKNLAALGLSIVTAAIVSDFDPVRALGMADRCVNLTSQLVSRFKNGTWPVPITLKEYRLTMFCRAVLRDLRTEHAYYMAKLAQLFVPVGWHVGGVDNSAEGVKWLNEMSKEGNFSAYAALGKRLARCGNTKGYKYLQQANHMGDVAAPIVLGDLYRDTQPEQAQIYYNTAISRGSALAALHLGDMYLHRKFPNHIADSGKKAAELFQCSVDRGNKRAALRLAHVLHDGAPGQAPDVDKAVLYYTEARNDSTVPLVRVAACIGLARVFEDAKRLRDAANELFHVFTMKKDSQFVATMNIEQRLQERVAYALCKLARYFRDLGAISTSATIAGQVLTAAELRTYSCQFYKESVKFAGPLSSVTAGDAWYGLGMLHLEMGDHPAALEGFRNATSSGHKEAPHNLGNLLLEMGRTHHALLAFEEGARRGDSAAANNAAQLTLQLKGDWTEAHQWYERAMELGSATAAANLSSLLAKGGQQEAYKNLIRVTKHMTMAEQNIKSDTSDGLIETVDELGVFGQPVSMPNVVHDAFCESKSEAISTPASEVLDSPKDVMERTFGERDVIMTPLAEGMSLSLSSLKLSSKNELMILGRPRKRAASSLVGRELKKCRHDAVEKPWKVCELPVVPVSFPWMKLDVRSWVRLALAPMHVHVWRGIAEAMNGVSVARVAAQMARRICTGAVDVSGAIFAIIVAARVLLHGNGVEVAVYRWRSNSMPRHAAFAEVLTAQVFCLQHRYFGIREFLVLTKAHQENETADLVVCSKA